MVWRATEFVTTMPLRFNGRIPPRITFFTFFNSFFVQRVAAIFSSYNLRPIGTEISLFECRSRCRLKPGFTLEEHSGNSTRHPQVVMICGYSERRAAAALRMEARVRAVCRHRVDEECGRDGGIRACARRRGGEWRRRRRHPCLVLAAAGEACVRLAV